MNGRIVPVPGLAGDIVMPNGDVLWVHARIPQGDEQLPLPRGWHVIQRNVDGNAYRSDAGHTVILSGRRESDGQRWLHLSVSVRGQRYPSWGELEAVKTAFLGRDSYAVSVIPPVDRYVRIHPWVLHLFSPVDGYPLPEFSGVVAGRRTL